MDTRADVKRREASLKEAIGGAAHILMGEPKRKTKAALYYDGGIQMDLKGGQWRAAWNDGGGVLDLVRWRLNIGREAALRWLYERHLIGADIIDAEAAYLNKERGGAAAEAIQSEGADDERQT